MIAPERGKKHNKQRKKADQNTQDPTDNILICISYTENKKDETEEFLQ